MTAEELAFIQNPETVDFVIRRSQYLTSQLPDDPNILVAKTLAGRYSISYASRDKIPEIQRELGSGFISSVSSLLGIMDRPGIEAAGITQIQEQPYLDLKGSGVLIGFVDTGIDYTKEVFRYEDGSSKIRYIFDQSIDSSPPEGFYIGTEYTRDEITSAINSPNPYSIVPQRDEVGHGTYLASVAAGRNYRDYQSAAPDSEIIMVKLRSARPYYLEQYGLSPDFKNAYESSSVMIGVEYILDKAQRLNKPVIICIGLGTNFGSHDGFSIFEDYLSGVSNLRGVCVVTAAGNECQERHHMRGIVADGGTANIDIKTGNSGENLYISIWNNVSDRLSVSVRSPAGELIGRVPARSGLSIQEKLVLEPSVVNIQYYFPIEGSGGQLTVVRILSATPGIWTIKIYGDIVLSGVFDAWLPISDFISDEIEFLSATPYTTITIPATMFGGISCGAYNHTTQSLYANSSWGPNRTGAVMPELTAPGVDIGGYFPTGYGRLSGTSVSAAITAGACALLMQWGIVQKNDISMSTYQIRSYLIRGCNRDPNLPYPNNQWGYGTLNLARTFELMREV